MSPTLPPPLHALDLLLPPVFAGAFVLLASRLPEPVRQRFNAIFVAGAGAAYFSGGLGLWEYAFTAVLTVVAYRGLASYRALALAWLLHAAWDLVHHLYGSPIIALAPTSSAGCALADPLLALWFFLGAPAVPARLGARLPAG